MRKMCVVNGVTDLGGFLANLDTGANPVEDKLNTGVNPVEKSEKVRFMQIWLKLGESWESVKNAAAVMKEPYYAKLVRYYQETLPIPNLMRSKTTSRKFRTLFGFSQESRLYGTNTKIPERIMEHAGVDFYCIVFAVERNGYAVISPDESAVKRIESAPLDKIATTIDFYFREISNYKLNLEKAVATMLLCQHYVNGQNSLPVKFLK